MMQNEMGNMNSPVSMKETESIIKSFPTKKPLGLDDFTGEL